MWWAQLLNNQAALLGGGAPAVGDYESISTVTVGSGGASSITFSSIPSSYSHLQIRLISKSTNSAYGGGDGDWLGMRFNSDSGNNYARHYIQGNGANVFTGANSTYSRCIIERGANANSSGFGAIVVDILDYTSTSKNKTVRSIGGLDNNGGGQMYFNSSLWYATPAAITQIDITPELGNFAQYSSFALYGIR